MHAKQNEVANTFKYAQSHHVTCNWRARTSSAGEENNWQRHHRLCAQNWIGVTVRRPAPFWQNFRGKKTLENTTNIFASVLLMPWLTFNIQSCTHQNFSSNGTQDSKEQHCSPVSCSLLRLLGFRFAVRFVFCPFRLNKSVQTVTFALFGGFEKNKKKCQQWKLNRGKEKKRKWN